MNSTKIPIVFSTITGNAFKLAEAVAPVVPGSTSAPITSVT